VNHDAADSSAIPVHFCQYDDQPPGGI